jgi:hypothetical protein
LYPSYANKENKPELNLCFINHWPDRKIAQYKIITKVFDDLDFFLKETKIIMHVM